jgi:large subunit ribosomal protein L33
MSERAKITLVCEDCGARNYETTKARAGKTERLTLKKHCSTCNKHTLHKESK